MTLRYINCLALYKASMLWKATITTTSQVVIAALQLQHLGASAQQNFFTRLLG